MEGARWDSQTGIIADACLKELTPAMPVIFVRAVPEDKQESRSVYQCPVYKTHQRRSTYDWTFNLKTKESPSKWTSASRQRNCGALCHTVIVILACRREALKGD
ncbi:hypothetical protein CesoFtcFv8_025677 [Champsocephalus esox]|uniref:Dynein heavy chain C-terminal domain-containing protein n=2 Tax=Champsocephalus TaxID=52236 RepID=A0AAN8C425_CHAGU|nr:hypothetical protein CesoFtcFv8_025677 [Champsocephalus esox]KAK5895515.1 hypothetical protein CgunFtcFv8_009202 [Champsocephalus gunnari]